MMSPFQTFATVSFARFSINRRPAISNSRYRVTRFGFVAGQWLSFKTSKPDGEEITRAYSIASPPGKGQPIRSLSEPGAGWLHVEFSAT
jgi:hypothetical protein